MNHDPRPENDWQAVRSILEEAVEQPAGDRTAFVRQVCGDRLELLGEVNSLLDAYQRSDGFLESLDGAAVSTLLAEHDEIEQGYEAGAYRVVRLLSRGGMGSVYLALDTGLNRQVALKFLPAYTASGAEAAGRLLTEARAAASLDHPNVGVIHEVGETADGRPFIAMAYYEGETLREAIGRGPLAPDEAARLGRQIVSGLRAAHRAGIVHRDVKPSNVLLTPDGLAKIVDFGIARRLDTEHAEGARSGTVAYMSPEQTRAEAVGPRSDIWSVGVVLYEMITGERPFQAKNHRLLFESIRHETPEPISVRQPDCPTPLANVVERCLRKDEDDRYPDADELAKELEGLETATQHGSAPNRRWLWRAAAALMVAGLPLAAFLTTRSDNAASPSVPPHRLAVLPFGYTVAGENPDEVGGPGSRSDDSDDGSYLAAGLTTELVSTLSRLDGLLVVGRTSAGRLADAHDPVDEVRLLLDAGSVLQGDVVRRSDSLFISLQLVDTNNRTQRWSMVYAGPAKDLMHLQEAMGRDVAKALPVVTSGGSPSVGRGTDNAEAYEEYLKGRYFLKRWSEPSITAARDHFQQALDLDPTFAGAWVGLANAYKVLDYLAVISTQDASPRIRTAAERALEVNPDHAEAHAVLAAVMTDYYYDWETAGHHIARALALDPGSADSRAWHAEYLRDLGQFEAALEEIDVAQQLDPLSPFYQLIEGVILLMARRPAEAMDQLEHLLALDPNYRMAHLYVGLVHAVERDFELALIEMDRVDPNRNFPDAVSLRAYAHASLGDHDRARQGLQELEALGERRYVSPFLVSVVLVALGERDRALDELERAFEERSWFVRLLNVAPFIDPLRPEPRFQTLVKRAGLSRRAAP